jgi:hypothetical protein
LLSPSGSNQPAYGQDRVTWTVACDNGFLYYNNCVLSALVAIILVAVGSVAFVSFVTFLCICFGCCKCCFVKRKYFEHEDDVVSLALLWQWAPGPMMLRRFAASASPASEWTRRSTSFT